MRTSILPSTTAMTKTELIDLIQPWQDALTLRVQAQELSSDTAVIYRRGAIKFINWLGVRRPSANIIRAWKADLLSRGVSPLAANTVNAWLAGVRSFFGWLAEVGEIPFNPAQAIKGASKRGKPRHVRESLSDHEVISLLAQPNRETPAGARDYAILCVMLYTAARGVELHRADLADLKILDGAPVLDVMGKGHFSKDDFLYLTIEAESSLREWILERGKDAGALFTSLSNFTKGKRLSRRAIRSIVKGYILQAGITNKNITTHSLRHTSISSALRNGAPLQKVMKLARHGDINTTLIYWHEKDRMTDPGEKYIDYSSEK